MISKNLFIHQILSLSFLGLSLAAYADTPALECFKQATRFGGMNQGEALQLCSGAMGTAPVECFRQVNLFNTIPPGKAVSLCQHANSVNPAQCYREAVVVNSLTPEQAIELCKTRIEVPGFFYPR